MGNFLALARSKGMANLVTTVCATGGGAFKFENNFKQVSYLFFYMIYFNLYHIINYKNLYFFYRK